jgi:hypothetical protein
LGSGNNFDKKLYNNPAFFTFEPLFKVTEKLKIYRNKKKEENNIIIYGSTAKIEKHSLEIRGFVCRIILL